MKDVLFSAESVLYTLTFSFLGLALQMAAKGSMMLMGGMRNRVQIVKERVD